MSRALDYLLKKEWSMGNGQCPDCCGVPPSWHGHPCHMTQESIGHIKRCPLAKAILAAGGSPVMLGEYKSDKEFERYISKDGCFGVRPKTKNGCPRYKAWLKKIDNELYEAVEHAADELARAIDAEIIDEMIRNTDAT